LSERRGGLWLSDSRTSDQTYLWRSVLSRESEVHPLGHSVTSLARRSRFGEACAGHLVRVHPSGLERLLELYEPTSRKSSVLTGQSTRPGEDPTGASARWGAAWMWPKEGWPAQHGARERREVSLVEITTGVHRGAGVPGGQKKYLQTGHGCN
jgi:hypothetical protein